MIVSELASAQESPRIRVVLRWLGMARSSWYAFGREKSEPKRPGQKPRSVTPELSQAIVATAERYPWWGYKRIAVIVRREGWKACNKVVWRVFREHGLLHRKRNARAAELHQATKLYELWFYIGPRRQLR